MNYGKAAYEKTEDILRRLSRLESEGAEPRPFRTLHYGGGYLLTENAAAERTCYFYSAKETDAECEFTFTFPSGLTGYVYFYLNGEFVTDRYYTTSEAVSAFSVRAKKGANALKAEISLQGSVSDPESITFSADISGVLDNRLIEPYLKSLNDNAFALKTDDTYTFFNLSGGNFSAVKTLFDAVEADCAAFGDGYLCAVKDSSRTCYLSYLDRNFEETDRADFGSSYKKLAVRNFSSPVVYALKGNLLVELTVSDGAVTERSLGIKGVDVRYFNAYDSEYLAVEDFLGNTFVYRIRKGEDTNIRRIFAIGKRESLFIPYDGAFRIWTEESGKIISRTVSDFCVYGARTLVAIGKQAVKVGNFSVVLGADGLITIH